MESGAPILTLMARKQLTIRLNEKAQDELAELKRLLDVESSRVVEMGLTHFLSSLEHGDPIYITRPEKPGNGHKTA